MKSRQECVTQIFNPNAFFFFLLTGTPWYYHAIYIVFTFFASFTDHEDDIFEVIFNLHVPGSNFGRKIDKIGRKSKNWIELGGFHWVLFFQDRLSQTWHRMTSVGTILHIVYTIQVGTGSLQFQFWGRGDGVWMKYKD